MNDFLNEYLKIQSEYFKRMQYLFILDLISIFSIFFAIFIIIFEKYLKQSPSYIQPLFILSLSALIIAIIGAFLLHRNDHKKNVALLIENKYPELREELRTAYDNRNETNVIVDALKSLVLSGLTIVSASRLIATSIIVTKIVIVTLVVSTATVVYYCPECRVSPETLTNTYTNISNTITGTTGAITNETMQVVGRPENIDTKVGAKGGGDIFGKPKIASIEGKNIDLTIYGGGTGFTPSEYSPDKNLFKQSPAFPVDVLGSNVSDGGYSLLMKKTETEKELINKYAVERSKI